MNRHGVSMVDRIGITCLCEWTTTFDAGGWIRFNEHLRHFQLDEPKLTSILSRLAPMIGGDLLQLPYRVGLASAILDALSSESDRPTTCLEGAWPCLAHDRHVLKMGRFYPGATPEEYGAGDWEPDPTLNEGSVASESEPQPMTEKKSRCLCPAPHDSKTGRCYKFNRYGDYCDPCRVRGFEWAVRLKPMNERNRFDWPKWVRKSARHLLNTPPSTISAYEEHLMDIP
jgi:hypothetical protein